MDTPLQLVVDQDGNAEAAAFCDSFLQLPVDDTSTDVAALCDSLLQACPPPPVPPPPSLQQHISSHLQQQEQEQQEQQQQQYQIKQEPQQQQLPQALYQQQQQRQQQQHQQQDQQLTPTTQQQNQPQQQTGYQMSQLQYLQQQLYHQQQQRNLLQQHYQQQQQLQQFQQQQHQLQQYQRQQQFLQQYSMYQNSQAPLAQHHHHHQQHHHQQQQHQQAPCMPALSSSLSSTSSTLTSSSLSPSRSSENYSMLWSKAHLNLDTTKLANMVNDWTPEEWNARRRLVHFQRSHQLFEGGILEIDCQISPMSQQQHHERRMQQNMAAAANAAAMAAAVAAGHAPTLQAPMPEAPPLVVSCIYWAERQDYYITSVDCIYLLEGLIGVQFTVEEKNRIRRNLEGFRPLTVSKSKEDSASFFRLIMSFPHPKPRNIEKDVKVFAWSSLGHALRKIVRKHTPSYSSTALPCSYAPY